MTRAVPEIYAYVPSFHMISKYECLADSRFYHKAEYEDSREKAKHTMMRRPSHCAVLRVWSLACGLPGRTARIERGRKEVMDGWMDGGGGADLSQ